MMLLKSAVRAVAALTLCAALVACSDDNDELTTPAQDLLARFGSLALLFTESGMQALLDFEDTSSPVILLQLMTVHDADAFARYEAESGAVWAAYGAAEVFASYVFQQFVGEREITQVRAIQFPNTPMLIDAMHSDAFSAAMETLFTATSDHAWVLGVEADLGIEFTGGFFDPTLLNLDEAGALARLVAVGGGAQDSSFASDPQPIIDMLVSDSPEPFYMVNLIDFYEQANYPDGRDSDLTGEEANAIYGEAIGPQLFLRNSGPDILMPVAVILTDEERQWEQAVVVRYASRDAFLTIFPLNPTAGNALIHKDAGVEETLVYATERIHRTPPEPASGFMYNLRYCEILLPTFTAEGIEVEIWGAQGPDACPQEAWEALDLAAIAAENGAPLAIGNGPRFFTADWISNTDGLAEGEPRLFGEIEMVLFTTANPSEVAGETRYGITRVARDNIWHFSAGRRVYELIDPEGTRYIMQSFSRIVDPDLALEDLASLGDRLDLPAGWSFESRVLSETLEVPAVDGTAEVVQDDLSNTYQRVP